MEYVLSNHHMIVLNHYLKHFVNYFSEKNERIKMALKHLGIQRIKSQTVFPYFAVPPSKNIICFWTWFSEDDFQLSWGMSFFPLIKKQFQNVNSYKLLQGCG